MRSFFARAGAVLAAALCLSTANAQTIEIWAGGGTFRDTPASDVPTLPLALTVGPDGHVYVLDGAKGRVLRLNLDTQTATAMPGMDATPPDPYVPREWKVWSGRSIAFSPAGVLHIGTDMELFRADMQIGQLIEIGWNSWQSFEADGHMAFDADGRIYFPRRGENSIWVRDPWGGMRRFAGGQYPGFSGDGEEAMFASLDDPRSVAVDALGNVYIADTNNHRVRRVDAVTGIIETVAGNGEEGFNGDDIPATQAIVSHPTALAVDAAGNLYVYSAGNNRVRRVDAATGLISTVAGNGDIGYQGDGGPATEAAIELVFGNMAFDAMGNLYLADAGTRRVRRVDASTGIIDTVLGNGTMTFCGEMATRRSGCLGLPSGLALDEEDNLFIADTNNQRLREVRASSEDFYTIAGSGMDWIESGDGGPATDATFQDLRKLSRDAAGNLYIAGGSSNRVRRIDAVTGIITTVAGTGEWGFSGDGGPATAARFSWINHAVVGPDGDLYLSDSNNHRIRRVSAASGIVTTIAGNGLSTGPLGDGGPALVASISQPDTLRFDAAGNLLIADIGHGRIRRIDRHTGVITTLAGNGAWPSSGNGGPATEASLTGSIEFVLDAAGNIYVAAGWELRRIDAATGIINSAAPPWGLYTEEGLGLQYPEAMEFDSEGRLYVADGDEDVVFRISGLPVSLPDATAPVITPVVSGAAGPGGWYRGDVQVSWNTADDESDIISTSGCGASLVTIDTAGVTFTCSATSAGGTATGSITIRRDTVAPTLTFQAPTTAPNANGWYNPWVRVPFVVADDLSGVYSQSSASPLLVSTEGVGVSGEVVVTDQAGNMATFTTATFNIDRSGPRITPRITGTMGQEGWYTSDVVVSFEVDDPHSPFVRFGCTEQPIDFDTSQFIVNCIARSEGGETSAAAYVKRDATPPTLSFGAPSPAPNGAGWHATDVTIPFTVSDYGSLVLPNNPQSPVVIAGNGPGLTTQVTVYDRAGNRTSLPTPAVNIDRTPPAVTPLVNGTLGTNGWYTSDVTVNWAIDEAPGNILSSNGCGTASVVSDTAGVSFTCSVVSGGGSASASVTLKRDATAPVLTFGTPSPAPNVNGWNKTNVSVPFTRSDALSGVASTSATTPLVVSTEGAGVTGSVTVTDLAGNAATFPTVPRNIDKTAPAVTITSPAQGATYGFYQDVTADFGCTDLSLSTCVGTTANGALVNTRTAGERTYKVTGKDLALFTTAVTHGFTVASTFNFEGFLAPASPPPTLNLVARGSLVPVRWRLPDGNGGVVTSTASFTSATVGSLSCGGAPAVPLADAATGPTGISFDASTGVFTYNWQTGGSWTGCRKLTIRLRDNSLHELRFRFQ